MEVIRDLPYNLDAESAVLGSVLRDGDCVHNIMSMLREEMFFLKKNQLVFRCMAELYNRSIGIDVITLASELKKQGVYEEIGGKEYLLSIFEAVPSSANATIYAKDIADKAVLRSLIEVCDKVKNSCYESKDAKDISSYAVDELFKATSVMDDGGVTPLKTIVLQNYNQFSTLIQEKREGKKAVSGVPTGFTELDKKISGLQPAALVIVAARPAMGKTSFAINIAQNVAIKERKPVLIFSLEMSKEELVNRIISSEAKIESEKIRSGEITDAELNKFIQIMPYLAEAPIYIDDTASITVTEMRAKAKRIQQEKGLGLIVVDYLQLMRGKKAENRQAEVTDISRNLKILAKDLKVPVIAVSQLSRSAESRADNKPMLSDLRESGAIEQDADIVMFLYREEYYKPETTEKHNIGECIIAKHRAGEVGNFEMTWLGKYTSFYNMEKQHDV